MAYRHSTKNILGQTRGRGSLEHLAPFGAQRVKVERADTLDLDLDRSQVSRSLCHGRRSGSVLASRFGAPAPARARAGFLDPGRLDPIAALAVDLL